MEGGSPPSSFKNHPKTTTKRHNMSVISTTANKNIENEDAANTTKNKKHGGVNLFRVALYMIRRKSNGKSKSVHVGVVENKGMWKRLVGSMRLLPKIMTARSEPPTIVEKYEEVFSPPVSPNVHYTPSASSCNDATSSRYASAVNLEELDNNHDECAADANECEEDLTIDLKADEFIARFRDQLRLQRLNSVDNRFNEMIARGLR